MVSYTYKSIENQHDNMPNWYRPEIDSKILILNGLGSVQIAHKVEPDLKIPKANGLGNLTRLYLYFSWKDFFQEC